MQQDYYKNHPDLNAFRKALEHTKIPVCYNGDIFTPEDQETLTRQFPRLDRIMLGRGILRDPGLLGNLCGEGKAPGKVVRGFLEKILWDYQEICPEEKHVLFKMKELWAYMGTMYPDRKEALERLRKAETIKSYQMAVKEILG